MFKMGIFCLGHISSRSSESDHIHTYIHTYYRVLPGFREFAVFEKSKRFFILFFGWALQREREGVRALARAQIPLSLV